MNTPPTPNPLPLKGGKGFFNSVIASVAKQPRGFALKAPHLRVPREGGDPDLYTQAESGPLVALFIYSASSPKSSATISTMGSGLRSVSKIIRKR